ncbi:hypothetical protein [Pseudonocardia spinosispora]|uniref:hypothetical protein n=1 Tax=Pseudonocardia spinosispora TaxID=103441 RepID=UPI0012EC4C5B|nr:hypothetical protein [Pseudonocardia spinosispora]
MAEQVLSLKVRMRMLLAIILDAAFFAAWLFVLNFFDHLTNGIQASGDLEWKIAKVCFSVSTLGLILTYIFWDLREANLLLRSRFAKRRQDLEFQTGFPANSSPKVREEGL